MEHLLVQTTLGGINMQLAMLYHMAVILFLTLERVMIDNVVWHLYFMHSCIRWWWNERETVQQRKKRLEGKGKREECCRVEGSGEGGKDECVKKEESWSGERKQKREYNYMKHEWLKWKWLLEMIARSTSQKKLENRGEIKGKKRKVAGVTHTWKMVFWSPTTSPSPTVKVS